MALELYEKKIFFTLGNFKHTFLLPPPLEFSKDAFSYPLVIHEISFVTLLLKHISSYHIKYCYVKYTRNDQVLIFLKKILY